MSRSQVFTAAIVLLSTSLFLFLIKNIQQKPIQTTKINQVINSVTWPSNQVIYHGSSKKHEVALTFDADMTPGMETKLKTGEVKSWYNSKVIEILEETHTPATLFLTGMWIEVYPDISKTLAKNPLFELGNHSYSHPGFTDSCYNLKPIKNDQDQIEIEKTQKLLQGLTGQNNHIFRFPGGCFDKEDLNNIYKNNLLPIQWDVVSGDSFNQNTAQIVQRVLKNTQNGSIIVLHLHGGPNAPKTAEALPEIIKGLSQKGFTFVKVSTLLSELK